MANLPATTPLSGYDQTIGDMRLREADAMDMVTLAIPQKGLAKLKKAIKDTYGLAMPKPTVSVADKKKHVF